MADTTGAGSSATHGSQGADTPHGDPARPLTEERLTELLDERLGEKLDQRLNKVVSTHLKRLNQNRPSAPTADHGDDQDDGHDEEATDPRKSPGAPGPSARDRARIKALERQIADLTAKQADITKREAKLKRETLLRAAIEAANPVSVDDAFRILVLDPSLKESEDGGEFYVESDGAEVSLEAWAKKQIAARPHLQKPSGKGGNGNVPAGTSSGGGSQAIPKDLPPEERIRRWRAQQAANT